MYPNLSQRSRLFMGPKRPTVKRPAIPLKILPITPLSVNEMTLLASAARLDSALRRLDDDFDGVNKESFVQSILTELVTFMESLPSSESNNCAQDGVNRILNRYPQGPTSPRIHPIVEHVAEVWESAELTGVLFKLRALSLEEVATRCAKSTAKNPSWPNELHAPDLRPYLLTRVGAEDMWWLPMPPVVEDEGVQ